MNIDKDYVLKIVKTAFDYVAEKEGHNFGDAYADTYRGRTFVHFLYNVRSNFWDETSFSESSHIKVNRLINEELDRYMDVLYYFLCEDGFQEELESLGINSEKDLTIKLLRKEGSKKLNDYLDYDFDEGIVINGELEFYINVEATLEEQKYGNGGTLYLESEFTDGHDITIRHLVPYIDIEYNEEMSEKEFYDKVVEEVSLMTKNF